jgi:hypothetical protein
MGMRGSGERKTSSAGDREHSSLTSSSSSSSSSSANGRGGRAWSSGASLSASLSSSSSSSAARKTSVNNVLDNAKNELERFLSQLAVKRVLKTLPAASVSLFIYLYH